MDYMELDVRRPRKGRSFPSFAPSGRDTQE